MYSNKTAGALACQAECDADAGRCAAWSYVIGHAGTSPQPGVERSCRHGVLGCPLATPNVSSGARVPGSCAAGGSVESGGMQLQLAMPAGGAEGCDL